jgi:hypothetical protein
MRKQLRLTTAKKTLPDQEYIPSKLFICRRALERRPAGHILHKCAGDGARRSSGQAHMGRFIPFGIVTWWYACLFVDYQTGRLLAATRYASLVRGMFVNVKWRSGWLEVHIGC